MCLVSYCSGALGVGALHHMVSGRQSVGQQNQHANSATGKLTSHTGVVGSRMVCEGGVGIEQQTQAVML
jgi:hypothetical protein